ncbi:MAG: NAD(P)H-dependent oxidoreductase subunit E [Erysipelotrichaceae bacterium]|jgi:NADH-quinone oxidoreductase subunit E/NADP-reducing hydrogenase subunit HndA|nr:NAD(P)H-dependent oxidoreductase subunit E [Erysipelotrichaceae bacterium]
MEGLNAASKKKIAMAVAAHKDEKGPVKLMLHDIQHELGYIPFEAMEAISEATGVSVAEVYGVVTFYTQFTTQPKGKHIINICMGTACYVNGSQMLLDRILELTKAPVNGTSEDGLFSLDATRCLGACGLAPVAIVDGKVYGQAYTSKAVENFVLETLKASRMKN